uniref:Uncharacterized protein n=1 Tax=Rhizophora mucronata TaxID=61149 RepID=A0A2P2NF61_RHIMU
MVILTSNETHNYHKYMYLGTTTHHKHDI